MKQDVTIELFYSGAWQDVTSDVYTRDSITLKRGRQDEASEVSPSECKLTFSGAEYNPRNVGGSLHGLIGRNTPIRITTDSTDRRFTGEVPSWAPRRSVDENDVYVEVQAAGIMRRLGQASAPLKSSLERELVGGASDDDMIEYWPLEDGPNSISLRSALGGDPASVSGVLDLASFDEFPASGPVLQLDGGTFGTTVRAHAFTREYTIAMLLHVPDSGLPDGAKLLEASFSGYASLFEQFYSTDGSGSIWGRWTNDEGVVIEDFSANPVDVELNGNTVLFFVTFVDDASLPDLLSTVSWVRYINPDGVQDLGTGALSSIFETAFDPDLGALRSVTVGSSDADGAAVGHLSCWSVAGPSGLSPDVDLFDLSGPLTAHRGETAADRIVRLCGEEGVPVNVTGTGSDTAAMGPQGIDTLLVLLREAATADGGILGEDVTQLGLRYRTRTSLYNQAPVLTLDYGAGEVGPPLDPAEDDQGLRNDVTVKRPEGSAFRAEQATGPLSTSSPPDGVGRYDTSVDVNVVGDGFLPNQAGWRLHLGTVEEQRWPQITVDLDAAPNLAAAVAAIGLGDRLDIVNPPATLTPNTIRALVQGWSETIGSHRRKIRFNASPEIPWRVAEYDDTQGDLNKYDTAGSSLASQFVAGTDTSMSVSVDILPLWTTDAAEVPFDLDVGGVRLTVTAISGASSPQTFTITQTPVNGVSKTLVAGTGVRLWRTPVYAL